MDEGHLAVLENGTRIEELSREALLDEAGDHDDAIGGSGELFDDRMARRDGDLPRTGSGAVAGEGELGENQDVDAPLLRLRDACQVALQVRLEVAGRDVHLDRGNA